MQVLQQKICRMCRSTLAAAKMMFSHSHCLLSCHYSNNKEICLGSGDTHLKRTQKPPPHNSPVSVFMCIYIYIYMGLCLYVCIYVCMIIFTFACIHVTYVCRHIYVCIVYESFFKIVLVCSAGICSLQILQKFLVLGFGWVVRSL